MKFLSLLLIIERYTLYNPYFEQIYLSLFERNDNKDVEYKA